MSTNTPLYPFGFAFTDSPLTDFLDDTHPQIMPLATALANYWEQCEGSAQIDVTIHDYPSAGNTTIISATLFGFRFDKLGTVILNTEPRKLIGYTTGDYRTEDFACPFDCGSTVVMGQGFGPDNFY